jgi:hypothetical protein
MKNHLRVFGIGPKDCVTYKLHQHSRFAWANADQQGITAEKGQPWDYTGARVSACYFNPMWVVVLVLHLLWQVRGAILSARGKKELIEKQTQMLLHFHGRA